MSFLGCTQAARTPSTSSYQVPVDGTKQLRGKRGWQLGSRLGVEKQFPELSTWHSCGFHTGGSWERRGATEDFGQSAVALLWLIITQVPETLGTLKERNVCCEQGGRLNVMEPHLIRGQGNLGRFPAASLREAWISAILPICHKCLSYLTPEQGAGKMGCLCRRGEGSKYL